MAGTPRFVTTSFDSWRSMGALGRDDASWLGSIDAYSVAESTGIQFDFDGTGNRHSRNCSETPMFICIRTISVQYMDRPLRLGIHGSPDALLSRKCN